MSHQRSFAVIVALIATGLAAVVLASTGTAGAQSEDDGEPAIEISEVPEGPAGRSIPKPNSGRAPENPGDRGGYLQWLVLGLIVAFFGVATLSIRRAINKSRATPVAGGAGRD